MSNNLYDIGLTVELLYGFERHTLVSGSHAYGTSAMKGNRGHGTSLILCDFCCCFSKTIWYNIMNVGRSHVFSYSQHLNCIYSNLNGNNIGTDTI